MKRSSVAGLTGSYFESIARNWFMTSPAGERLFCADAPLSRPYVIPDQATEQRLLEKVVLWVKLGLGGILICLLSLPPTVPIMSQPIWFFGFLLVALFSFQVTGHFLLRGELRGLARSTSRFPLRAYYADLAARSSRLGLAFGFLGSLSFTAVGLWMAVSSRSNTIGWFVFCFFGLCAISWGYTLALRLYEPTNTDAQGNTTGIRGGPET
jgi:hypothetical protein